MLDNTEVVQAKGKKIWNSKLQHKINSLSMINISLLMLSLHDGHS